jgi:hypothetical protein
MSGVFQNIDPHPLTPWRVCIPHAAFGAGGEHTRWVERGCRGSLVRKTPDTALYSIYVCKYFVGIIL